MNAQKAYDRKDSVLKLEKIRASPEDAFIKKSLTEEIKSKGECK